MDTAYAYQYLLIGLLTVAAIGFGVAPLVLARCVAPNKPSPTKLAPYECGMESSGDPWIPFNVQFYIYALLFVVFDVEVVFIYPWALVWKDFGPAMLVEMVLFLGILGVGLAYAWKKGALEWK